MITVIYLNFKKFQLHYIKSVPKKLKNQNYFNPIHRILKLFNWKPRLTTECDIDLRFLAIFSWELDAHYKKNM